MPTNEVDHTAFFQDMRDEYHLSNAQLDHVKWFVGGGRLNLVDVRSMLARHAAGSH